jgi:hypothetical protein
MMASGQAAPHQQAEHMAAPTSLAPPSKKTLANGEPSTHGTNRTYRGPQAMAAIALRRPCILVRGLGCPTTVEASARILSQMASLAGRY